MQALASEDLRFPRLTFSASLERLMDPVSTGCRKQVRNSYRGAVVLPGSRLNHALWGHWSALR